MQLRKSEDKPRKERREVQHKRFWWTLLASVAGLIVLGIAYYTIFVQSTNPQTRSPKPPSVKPQELRPSSYQLTRRLYGPWKLIASGSAGAPHLVMLNANSGVEVSPKTVTADHRWKRASAFEIDSVVPGHSTVRIHTTNNNVFTVNYRQGFILAQRPGAVYAFLANGPNKALLVSKSVASLHKS